MSPKKKNCLKSASYSFRDRGHLSRDKDLDVDYVVHKRSIGKDGNPGWLESCADPLYKTSPGPSHLLSPRKRLKEVSMELPDIQHNDMYQEMYGDFVAELPRHMKVCLPVEMLQIIALLTNDVDTK